MGRLHYSVLCSLDGYVADREGGFGWAMPDAEVHAHVNDLEREIGTHLLGRRMYEVMSYWETADTSADDAEGDYARIWQAADKVVYSTTLPEVSTARTRLVREFDPAAVADLVAASGRDVSIGGADLADQALQAGLVDEVGVYLFPVLIGAGTHWLPEGLGANLTLVDEHRFNSGVVHLRYTVSR